jgi:hypothetical protein
MGNLTVPLINSMSSTIEKTLKLQTDIEKNEQAASLFTKDGIVFWEGSSGKVSRPSSLIQDFL